MKHVGREIIKIIREKSLTQKELAERLAISEVKMSRICKQETLDIHTLENICRELKVSPQIFFEYSPRKTESEIEKMGMEYALQVQELSGNFQPQQPMSSKDEQWYKDRIESQEQTIKSLIDSITELSKKGGAVDAKNAVSKMGPG